MFIRGIFYLTIATVLVFNLSGCTTLTSSPPQEEVAPSAQLNTADDKEMSEEEIFEKELSRDITEAEPLE
ncbi:MAG: hypothetical protein AB7T49_12370 [Oligoflexales bacterium]